MASERIRGLIEALQGELAEMKDDAARIEEAITVLRAQAAKKAAPRKQQKAKPRKKATAKNASPELKERILAYLASVDGRTTVADVAQAVGVHPSSASNALAVLEREEKVVNVGEGGGRGRKKLYAPTPRAARSGQNGDLLEALRREPETEPAPV